MFQDFWVLVLNHMISLFGWLKRVIFGSEACLSRSIKLVRYASNTNANVLVVR